MINVFQGLQLAPIPREQLAGFWLRLAALLIDLLVVYILIFPFAMIIGLMIPKQFLVEPPFGLFTTTSVVSEATESHDAIEKDIILGGMFENYYKLVENEKLDVEDDTSFTRVLVESEMKNEVSKWDSGNLFSAAMLIYWILFEASVWQASVGKKLVGLKVVNIGGERPTLTLCVIRNLFKIVSAIPLYIGFLFAAWTSRKQAWHDFFSMMLVVKRSKS